MDGEFNSRVALVTGGARGLGRAFARALHDRGAQVFLLDVDFAEARKAAVEIGPRAGAVELDVADRQNVETVVAQIAGQCGGIDILINNAGIHSVAADRYFGELDEAEARRMFDVNVWGVINCCLAARPYMCGRPGASIVNISSIASYGAQKAYGVTKLAVRGLTASFAHEFAGDGIRVNGIAPGLILTDVIRSELPPPVVERVVAMQMIGRPGEEADITGAMLWLVSAAASFVTGETIRVGGGAAHAV